MGPTSAAPCRPSRRRTTSARRPRQALPRSMRRPGRRYVGSRQRPGYAGLCDHPRRREGAFPRNGPDGHGRPRRSSRTWATPRRRRASPRSSTWTRRCSRRSTPRPTSRRPEPASSWSGRRPSRLPPVARVEVDKSNDEVRAYGASGNIVAVFPATVGSTERPAPTGLWAVRSVVSNPTYTYDPSRLTFGDRSQGKLTIRPGPEQSGGLHMDRSNSRDLRNPWHVRTRRRSASPPRTAASG